MLLTVMILNDLAKNLSVLMEGRLLPFCGQIIGM